MDDPFCHGVCPLIAADLEADAKFARMSLANLQTCNLQTLPFRVHHSILNLREQT